MSTGPTFPRGSEWRRWDLQIHTPDSVLNNEFGTDFDNYAKILFERAIADGIAVIGITDYFTIEGYKKLRDLVDDVERLDTLLGTDLANQARLILLLPNIEFRTSDVIRGHDGDAKVNFHIIFSDEVDPRDIEENFLPSISRGSTSSENMMWKLTF